MKSVTSHKILISFSEITIIEQIHKRREHIGVNENQSDVVAIEPVLVTELKVALVMVLSFADLFNITYHTLAFHGISIYS